MKVGCVPASMWGDVREMLLPAIDRDGEFTEAEVVEEIATHQAQLWVAIDDQIRCAAVTRISKRPAGPVCELWLLGGRRLPWVECLSVIEAAARERGCVAISFIGRPGWERILPDFERVAVIMRKAL